MNNLLQILKKMFEYEEPIVYDFTIPEKPSEEKENKITFDNEFKEQESKNDIKKIFSSFSDNLEYMKIKYSTTINSDILIREFTLTANGKQYNAFLIYIDGMVDTELINDFILKPLMLKNRANMYDTNGTSSKETVFNNVSIKRVKKFNLADYIFNNLMPQNSVKKVQEFKKIISRSKLSATVLYLSIH